MGVLSRGLKRLSVVAHTTLILTVSIVLLAAFIGCRTTPVPVDFQCPATELSQWEIPAGSLDGRLSIEQAYEMVLTGNLPIDGIRDRWTELADRMAPGDEFWSYALEDEQLVNDVGGQEGVVLIRGCRQLGFVATSIGLTPP